MLSRSVFARVVVVCLTAGVVGCGAAEPSAPPAAAPATSTSTSAPAAPADPEDPPLPPSDLEARLPPAVRESILKPFTGDFKEMLERKAVRVGVVFSRTFYFVDKGVQRGTAYDYGLLMEERINAKIKSGNIKVHVVFIPMSPQDLLPALINGHVDLVAGHLTITPERQKLVDFTDPTRTNVNEIVVTGPGTTPVASVDDLSGRDVFVRQSSSYHSSLLALNQKLTAGGKAPVVIRAAPENLQDDDLLEMVNAGLIPAMVVDDYLAHFWKKVFTDIVVHDKVTLRTGGNLGVAVRKNNPELRAALNTFMGKYGLGTAFGNNVERKYLVNTTYVKRAASEAERRKFLAVVQLFRKYSEKYEMDFLMMAAQGYQESRLDQDARSHVGAIGIMQVMPPTGKEMNVGDISQLEPNIHAGVKYMRTVMNSNFKDGTMDPLNKGLMTFASYNAGPGRVRQLRREAEKRGLDPNVWFGNVEQIASERIGRETVTYVSNIYKYYIAYKLVMEENERREAAKKSITTGGGSK
jgi:membrane-bound lytic murein transglycosylase MltF